MKKCNKTSVIMYKHFVQKSATKSATKIAQCLCCTFYIATCVYQVGGNSPLLGWILIWGYRLYFSPV